MSYFNDKENDMTYQEQQANHNFSDALRVLARGEAIEIFGHWIRGHWITGYWLDDDSKLRGTNY